MSPVPMSRPARPPCPSSARDGRLAADQFDRLIVSLSTAGSRRSLVRLLTGLPVAGRLAGLLGEATPASARRQRHHQQRHHPDHHDRVHDEKKKKKKRKKKKPHSPSGSSPLPSTCAQTCAGCCMGETCVSATSTAACGANGAPCATCSGLQGSCFTGACHCDVCAGGCRYASVQAAVADPSGPTTITICAGTYTGNVSIDRGVTLIGAGDGAGVGSTVLQGTGSGSVVTATGAITETMRALQMTDGRASLGGGIGNDATLMLTDCTVTEN